MLTISDVEQYLSKNGKFSLLDWLLSENFLSYHNYEAWRYGVIKTLDDHIDLDSKALSQLFDATTKHAKTLNLSAQLQEYFSWQEHDNLPLFGSNNKDTHQQLTQQWLRPQDQPQLDLFMDNSAAIAENHLLSALGGRQWQQAREYLHTLTQHNPNHSLLGQYLDLVNYGDHMQANESIAAEAITSELQGLQSEVQPLARETLGDTARDYLAYAWRRMANNLSGIAFSGKRPKHHRSYALRQIPDWSAIKKDLSDDSQLYQFPQLLEHLAASHAMLNCTEVSLLLWCHIFEIFPDYAQEKTEQNIDLPKPVFSLWQQYWEANDSWPVDFFPGFILLTYPGLLHVLTEVQPLKHIATKAVITLLRRRQMSEDEIRERKQLQKVSPELLQLYLKQNVGIY